MLIANRFDFSWFSYFRCSNADDEAFALMAQSGCKGVFLGIESADPTVLKNMNKHADPSRYRYGIGKLKEHGILTFAALIVGYPGETRDTLRNTMDFIDETGPTFYRAELYYHDRNTPVHDRAVEFGIEHEGYSWRHRSMDWQEACDHVDAFYREIRQSTILPLYMFDFWSIPYLVGKGLSIDTLTSWMRIAQEMLVAGLGDHVPNTAATEEQLVSLLQARRCGEHLVSV
jgi:p-methyltransferase